MNTEKEFFHKDLTKDVLDSAFKVHNALGCGLLENIYSNGLCWDLELKGWSIAQLMGFRVQYRDKEVGIYYADIVVDGKVIVEVKSVDRLDDITGRNC